MNNKKAIEFLESFKDKITSIDIEEGNKEAIEKYNNEINKVIELLQHGEKYRLMWNKFKNIHGDIDTPIGYIKNLVKPFEQKYLSIKEGDIK